MDRPSSVCPSGIREQTVRRAIGRQDHAMLIQRQNRRRAAFHQDAQLLLGLAPQFLLALDLGQMSPPPVRGSAPAR